MKIDVTKCELEVDSKDGFEYMNYVLEVTYRDRTYEIERKFSKFIQLNEQLLLHFPTQ